LWHLSQITLTVELADTMYRMIVDLSTRSPTKTSVHFGLLVATIFFGALFFPGEMGRRSKNASQAASPFKCPLEIRRHLMRAMKRHGFGWKRWSNQWIYQKLGLFNNYRVKYRGHC
jgi:hypothetical protein